ncbi:hypothetical protein BSL78_26936 [Apostichopus japonicus]|uniref:Heme-binding protein 2-like n=1 Tax=Stichopus japonicus TaxID=307972 RepID=A0A2G8JKF8_STIJA|nr:hypothetical protein BSL78_26936 [Apostichopus japonicus]
MGRQTAKMYDDDDLKGYGIFTVKHVFRGKECPRYTELNGHVKDLTNVTVRRVEAGVYATRTSTKCNLTDALIDSYLPLHYYFYGQEVRMNRTIPIMLFTTKMPAEHRCDYTHQLQFYLPLVNHTNYPDPTEESRVQVTAKQEECFVVYHWIGKITTQATYNNYFNLKTNLTDSDSFNLAYNENKFAHARYDPSCRPGARHEIWIPLDSCPGAAESSSSD